MFNRLRSAEPISSGVHFLRGKGLLLPINNEYVLEHKVVEQGFIIGVSINDFLYPIYDQNREAVVVRLSDMMNIPIGAFEAMELPYYREIRPHNLPRNLQPGEGSSRGSN